MCHQPRSEAESPEARWRSLKAPDLSSKIWRYMHFSKFMWLLENKQLHLARVDKLAEADPFEGSFLYSPLVSDELASMGMEQIECISPSIAKVIRANDVTPKQFVENWKRDVAELKTLVAVSCWHQADGESDAMWKLYSHVEAGVAVRSTAKRLLEAIDAARLHVEGEALDHFLAEVQYGYEDLSLNTNALAPFVHKPRWFEHEREIRALVVSGGELRIPDEGIGCPIDLNSLVEEVYVSPLAPLWVEDLVCALKDRYGLDAPVRQSSLRDRPAL